jgi:hypothetical protein
VAATRASLARSGAAASPLVSSTNALPPLPPSVGKLKFSKFIRQPIGQRGLEYSEKLRSLEGRRIRILGYLVGQDHRAERRFRLAPKLHVFATEDAPAQTPTLRARCC